MIELCKVESENKVYVNDKVIVLDRDTITASELLGISGFSSLVYYTCLIHKNEKKNKKANKSLIEMHTKQAEKNMFL
jgi:hypothetical protein